MNRIVTRLIRTALYCWMVFWVIGVFVKFFSGHVGVEWNSYGLFFAVIAVACAISIGVLPAILVLFLIRLVARKKQEREEASTRG